MNAKIGNAVRIHRELRGSKNERIEFLGKRLLPSKVGLNEEPSMIKMIIKADQ